MLYWIIHKEISQFIYTFLIGAAETWLFSLKYSDLYIF